MSFVQEAHTAGWQVWTHANGDCAIDSVINAYTMVGGNGTARRLRHRIEHCQLANDEQLDRIAQLGLGVSFFAAHVWHWGDRHRDVFIGLERASRMDPLRSAQRRGIRFGLHNDTPVTPIDPLLSISTAATRITSSGEQLGEDETVSVRHALRAMTLDSAWLAHEENDKGSLEVGKLGDVVILGADPLEVSPDEIRRIPVEATLVGGTPVYLRHNGGGIYD
jgi:hypothetical protein